MQRLLKTLKSHVNRKESFCTKSQVKIMFHPQSMYDTCYHHTECGEQTLEAVGMWSQPVDDVKAEKRVDGMLRGHTPHFLKLAAALSIHCKAPP